MKVGDSDLNAPGPDTVPRPVCKGTAGAGTCAVDLLQVGVGHKEGVNGPTLLRLRKCLVFSSVFLILSALSIF